MRIAYVRLALIVSWVCLASTVDVDAVGAQRRVGPRAPGALPAVPPVAAAELDRSAPEAEWAAVAGWPGALPSPRLEGVGDQGVSIVRRSFPDGVREIRALGMGERTAVWTAWLDAVRRAGGTVENERTGADWASATLCAASCARGRWFASMTTDSWLRVVLRSASPRTPTPPGACRPVPDDRWRICWETANRSMCSFDFGTRWDLDVDRDGVPDALVALPAGHRPERTCPHEIQWEVYVSRGACGHRIGRLRGEIDRWHHATTELSRGYVVLTTVVEPAGPWAAPVVLRNEVRAPDVYREVAMTEGTSRCAVHPAACEDYFQPQCAVRDHPSIAGPYDADATSAITFALSQRAQQQCSAGVAPPVRCSVDLVIDPRGGIGRLSVRGCPARTACVERIFRGGIFSPHSGDPGRIGISFQLPAP